MSYDKTQNEILSSKIKEHIGLEISPVAVKLFIDKSEIPEEISKVDGNEHRHCEMVQKANKGDIFYATAAELQGCKGGVGALGLMEMPEPIKTGAMHHSMGKFSSRGAAKRTVDAIPKIEPTMDAIAYAPLENAPFDPDVVIIIAKPLQAMKISQGMLYNMGGRLEANFGGIQSICSDTTAGPYNTGKPNFTLGCFGSRKFAKVQADEIIVGMNGENLSELVKALDEREPEDI
jgi:uncharacterized protein (DUF169 family)